MFKNENKLCWRIVKIANKSRIIHQNTSAVLQRKFRVIKNLRTPHDRFRSVRIWWILIETEISKCSIDLPHECRPISTRTKKSSLHEALNYKNVINLQTTLMNDVFYFFSPATIFTFSGLAREPETRRSILDDSFNLINQFQSFLLFTIIWMIWLEDNMQDLDFWFQFELIFSSLATIFTFSCLERKPETGFSILGYSFQHIFKRFLFLSFHKNLNDLTWFLEENMQGLNFMIYFWCIDSTITVQYRSTRRQKFVSDILMFQCCQIVLHNDIKKLGFAHRIIWF